MPDDTLTVDEALAAYDYADSTIRECDGDMDKLDAASDVGPAFDAACPADFSKAQRSLAQRIILDAYMRAIARA